MPRCTARAVIGDVLWFCCLGPARKPARCAFTLASPDVEFRRSKHQRAPSSFELKCGSGVGISVSPTHHNALDVPFSYVHQDNCRASSI